MESRQSHRSDGMLAAGSVDKSQFPDGAQGMTTQSNSLCWIVLGLVGVAGIGGCMPNSHLGEAERQAADFGLDYDQARSDAHNDDQALRRFFLLSFVVDAAGAEQYGSDLCSILKDIGERRFLRVLHSSGWDVQTRVVEVIQQDQGFSQKGGSWSRFTVQYPGLAKAIESLATSD